MVVLSQKLQEIEPERNRLLRDNTRQLQTITRLEIDRKRDKAKSDVDGMKVKLETAEDNLSQALSEIDNAKKAAYDEGYQKGFDAAMANYLEQMLAIQDQIWATCWEACLTKARIADDSPL